MKRHLIIGYSFSHAWIACSSRITLNRGTYVLADVTCKRCLRVAPGTLKRLGVETERTD